jgi:capsular exopolysaccharide synthesis family protein
MEKIVIALQRALDSMHEDDARVWSEANDGSATGPNESRSTRIVYTKTRSVQVPPHVLERHRITLVNGDTSGDAFRLLRTQLLMRMRQNGWRTLAVTSPNKGAGKSTIALNLAIGFAMEVDHTALLVDADLRDPDIRNMLELPPGPGLVDYLMHRAALADLLIHPDIGNLVLLPGGAPVAHTSELMRSPMMQELVREVRARYRDRLVVFDVPSILSSADALALSAYMDAAILVVEECKTVRDDIARACELLRDSNLVGIVLNKSRELPDPEPIRWPKPGPLRRLFGTQG